MWTILVNRDLKNLPKNLFLLILLAYPLFSYVVLKGLGMDKKAFGLICLSYLLFRGYQIYKTQSNLAIPSYVALFGLFTAYTLLVGMFNSDYLAERGIKYFYSNSIWLTFIAFLIVENIHISHKELKFAKKILEFTLVLASVVSIIQISSPFFLVNDQLFVQGVSYDRMAEYYKNNPNGISDSQMGYVSRLGHGDG